VFWNDTLLITSLVKMVTVAVIPAACCTLLSIAAAAEDHDDDQDSSVPFAAAVLVASSTSPPRHKEPAAQPTPHLSPVSNVTQLIYACSLANNISNEIWDFNITLPASQLAV
jgi:hypothetical protein